MFCYISQSYQKAKEIHIKITPVQTESKIKFTTRNGYFFKFSKIMFGSRILKTIDFHLNQSEKYLFPFVCITICRQIITFLMLCIFCFFVSIFRYFCHTLLNCFIWYFVHTLVQDSRLQFLQSISVMLSLTAVYMADLALYSL